MRAHIRKILLGGALIAVTIYAICILQSNKVDTVAPTVPQPWIQTVEETIHAKPEPVTSSIIKRTIPVETKIEESQKPIASPINVSLSAGDYSAKTVVPTGSSVYELMSSLKTKGLTFDARYFGSGMGYFITGINGKLNDEKNGTYWTLYVNGKESPLGASSYILKDSDSVSWKFENRLNQ